MPTLLKNFDLSVPGYTTYAMAEHLHTLKSLEEGDLKDEDAILALPRRRNKSQRPLAAQLAKELYPSLSEIAALIKYDILVIPAKVTVRQKKRERHLAQVLPKTNAGGKLLKIQGPWAGQEADPVDIARGPRAIAMPVTIGDAEDFEPIFSFLSLDKPFPSRDQIEEPGFDFVHEDTVFTGRFGRELNWHTPLLEFKRGIVYNDGRLDLCKKVVGPTHIRKLMESLESNHQIRHFLLGNNVISTTGAKAIASFLEKYPDRMETWYIAGCHLTQHALSLLVPTMVASSMVTNLWFKRNPFGADSAPLLAELVLGTANLRTLDLETVELSDKGTQQFIDAITGKSSSLRHLYLNANGIGKIACVSLGTYLADSSCILESLFLSTNPIGDVGMSYLAKGIAENSTLKRLMLASTGLTSQGITSLAVALCDESHPLHTLDLSASQTTKAHGQRFNYIDDDCIEAIKRIILSPYMRWLNLGHVVFSAAGLEEIRSAAAASELVYLGMHRVDIIGANSSNDHNTTVYDGVLAPKSCSLTVRKRMEENVAKYYPHIKNYHEFLNSEEFRFLRNTSDVRKIDSMYRTLDKRLGLPMDEPWEEGDLTWEFIVEDAENGNNELGI
ncbi:leucine rich repeat protein [Xylogone sp. PMI_703]|nr:leucine rich repeat protein [Xylogone sp. PMI_703]